MKVGGRPDGPADPPPFGGRGLAAVLNRGVIGAGRGGFATWLNVGVMRGGGRICAMAGKTASNATVRPTMKMRCMVHIPS